MRVEVIVGDDTVWLTQAQMVDLFGRDLSVVARHIQNVFAEGELARETSLQILQTSPGEMGRPTTLYNLDVVISVGYRVKSKRGTQFRIWATSVLRAHDRRKLGISSPPCHPTRRVSAEYFETMDRRLRPPTRAKRPALPERWCRVDRERVEALTCSRSEII